MKILHTADWHLGQRFLHFDRKIEHDQILHWLTKFIQQNSIDLLIIAGDIFDTGNPPNYALQQYYNFLKNILKTRCKNIIIIGGNHDSPSMLNAPKDLLNILNVHVVGSIEKSENQEINIQKEIIELQNEEGNLIGVIAAVPFLRDRDLKFGASGETSEQRVQAIKNGIAKHYQLAGEAAEKYTKNNIPIIATGHLFAAGGTASDSENDIHIGNLGQVTAQHFPDIFHYVALGHLHKPQVVGQKEYIRYSGSPIPLSFSERDDQKQVLVIEFEATQIKSIESVPLPTPRKLLRFKGDFEAIQQKILAFDDSNEQLDAWVEAVLDADTSIPRIDLEVKKLAEGKKMEVVKVSTRRKYKQSENEASQKDLEELTPMDVFEKKCLKQGLEEENIKILKSTFLELLSEMESDE